MKYSKTRFFKPSSIVLFAGLVCLTFISASVFANGVSLSDKRFLKAAAQAGAYEIEGSRLALNKAKSPAVKTFAQHIIDDHTKAAAELKALAAKKKVDLPDKPSVLQRASLKMLGMYEGAEFEVEYMENIGVDAHNSAIEDFTEAAQGADDPEVKAFAQKILPALQKHLEMAKTLEAKPGKAK